MGLSSISRTVGPMPAVAELIPLCFASGRTRPEE